jgi:hypothetical protein
VPVVACRGHRNACYLRKKRGVEHVHHWLGPVALACCLEFGAWQAPLHAAEPSLAKRPASASTDAFNDSVAELRWELAGLFAGITAIGIGSWDWGSSDFRFNSEHWFGMDTGSAGADKFGHAYSAQVITSFLASRQHDAGTPQTARNAALLASGLMLYVEVFDGFSEDHGFAYEDLAMNTLGVGFAYLRMAYPAIRDTVDFRLQYWPSKYVSGYRPLSDYNGQTYVLALKLGGFTRLRDTPWHWLELHAGYYTRGFPGAGKTTTDNRQATAYLGFSVNFGALIQPLATHYPRSTGYASTALEYVQPPYTSIELAHSRRERPPKH